MPYTWSQRFSFLFFPRSYIVLAFVLRYIVHFEMTLKYGVSLYLKLFLFYFFGQMAVQLLQPTYEKDYSFLSKLPYCPTENQNLNLQKCFTMALRNGFVHSVEVYGIRI